MGKFTADEAEYQIQNYNSVLDALIKSLNSDFSDMDFENVTVKKEMEDIKEDIIRDIQNTQDKMCTLTFER